MPRRITLKIRKLTSYLNISQLRLFIQYSLNKFIYFAYRVNIIQNNPPAIA
ncbi:hypothetical protein EVA_13236 [gut metagenome]|uniref:Uncharacterized protein n=1 Tax=gut metagenome TaxID=749906 RepID=J9FVW3_9ZZZZ